MAQAVTEQQLGYASKGVRSGRVTPKWVRRARKIVAIILIAILVAHGVWIGVAVHHLNSVLAAHRGMGEPIVPEDLQTNLSDEENAAVLLGRAVSALKRDTSAYSQVFMAEPVIPATAQEMKALEEMVRENGEALGLVRQATTKPEADWKVVWKKPYWPLSLSFLSTQHELVVFVSYAIVYEHQRGREDNALLLAGDLLGQGRALGRGPTDGSHLSAIRSDFRAVMKIQAMIPELKMEGAGAADAVLVRQTVDSLLDESNLWRSLRIGRLSERILGNDVIDSCFTGSGSADWSDRAAMGLARYVCWPVFAHDQAVMTEWTTAELDAAKSEDWGTFVKQSPAPIPPSQWRIYHVFQDQDYRVVRLTYVTATFRRLAATGLAVKWYQQEHGGKLPGALEELVPRYLPRVPRDALGSGSEIRFRREEKDPVVYSVGRNGKGEGGSDKWINTPEGWEREDEVFHLRLAPPTDEHPVAGGGQWAGGVTFSATTRSTR